MTTAETIAKIESAQVGDSLIVNGRNYRVTRVSEMGLDLQGARNSSAHLIVNVKRNSVGLMTGGLRLTYEVQIS